MTRFGFCAASSLLWGGWGFAVPFYPVEDCSYSVNWSIASSMTSKLEPVIWLRDTGHIGIRGGADGRTYVHTNGHS